MEITTEVTKLMPLNKDGSVTAFTGQNLIQLALAPLSPLHKILVHFSLYPQEIVSRVHQPRDK